MDQTTLLYDINQRLGALGETVKTAAEAVHATTAKLYEIKGLASALVGEPATLEEDEDIVDPWTVESASEKGVDYDRLISRQQHLLSSMLFKLYMLYRSCAISVLTAV